MSNGVGNGSGGIDGPGGGVLLLFVIGVILVLVFY